MNNSTHCKTCHAPIRWETTPAGHATILDREPVAGGNVRLVDGLAVSVPKDEIRPGELLYLSHFATCPQAKQHKRPRR